MNTLRVLFVLGLSSAAFAASCGEHGEEVSTDCCMCKTGWGRNKAGLCQDICAKGYVLDPTESVCSNGRDGSACNANMEYPYWGCSINGKNFGQCSTGGVFPCVCDGGSCEEIIVNEILGGACYPSGTRMYTTFPNQPIVGNKYSLTLVGCNISSSDTYVVIPAFSADLTQETACSSLNTSSVPASCAFKNGDNVLIGSEGNCTGSSGFSLTGLKSVSGEKGMSEVTFQDIIMDEGAFGGTAAQRASANAAESGKEYQILEKETYFRVCRQVSVYGIDGLTTEFVEVASHDHIVSERDYMYKISKEELYDPSAAAAATGDGDSCCDGLKLGPLCLPLWVFLLLWVLMACCLGGMGYALNKNKNEIEAQKNNEKYEKFNVDAEMSAMAAKQADEDDDI